MNRTKFRILLGIGILCQFSAFLIQHFGRQHVDAKDFLTGMGTAVIAGAMILMARKTRLQ
jgi:hypothetical protein